MKIQTFRLGKPDGLSAEILNYGGILSRLWVPTKSGERKDVLIGFEQVEDYLGPHPSFNCLIGRVGNRIANGEFELRGKTYSLAQNAGEHHLHGGEMSWDRVYWEVEENSEGGTEELVLTYTSPDGEEGYPGTVDVKVIYRITDYQALEIQYEAKTDAPTLINPTHHAYFNLADEGGIRKHELQILAPYYTPVDASTVPTGEILKVKGTPLDFLQAKPIGAEIDADYQQLKLVNGYDHNFIFSKPQGQYSLVASVHEPVSGRRMEVFTDQPAVQLYTGNWLKDITGKGGKVYKSHDAFCLETQHYPDAPHHSHFPSIVLLPGQVFRSKTAYHFSWD